MNEFCVAQTEPFESPKRVAVQRDRKRFLCALCVLVFVFLLWMNSLTSGIAEQTNLLRRFAPPSFSLPFGTDQFGRDVLALLGAGAFSSIGLATAVVGMSAAIGVGFALFGASGPIRRVALVSIADTFLAVPSLVVALVVAATVGAGTGALLVALAVVGWTPYFRLVLGQVDAAQQQLWVEAAVASGAGRARVLVRHILPNVTAPLVALIATRIGHAVVSVSALSFLGVGPKPPSPEWGAVLAAAQPHAERAPWAVVAPSLAIFATTSTAFWIGRVITIRLLTPTSPNSAPLRVPSVSPTLTSKPD